MQIDQKQSSADESLGLSVLSSTALSFSMAQLKLSPTIEAAARQQLHEFKVHTFGHDYQSRGY
jgi:hypothetical protein